jgi:Flp pilus assembly protein CpaB
MAVKAFLLSVSALFSVFLGAGLRLWLHGAAAEPVRPDPVPETVEVLVAKQALEMNTLLKKPEQFFDSHRYRKEETPPDTFSNLAELRSESKQYLKVALRKGEPLTRSHLTGELTITPFPPGMRAMGIPFATYPGAELIVPGERVNIFGGPAEQQHLLVKGAPVLCAEGYPARGLSSPPGTTVIYVGVMPEDALRVSLSLDLGPLRVVLHSAKDSKE